MYIIVTNELERDFSKDEEVQSAPNEYHPLYYITP